MSLPPLAILAGGLATRMRPVTETIPKSLIPVRGEPFLAHQLRLVRRQGFDRVVLFIGHLGDRIERYLDEVGTFGLEIAFARDGDVRRGTGGALRNGLGALGDTFFVLYGDSYLDVDAAAVHAAFRASGLPVMMTVLHNLDRFDRSNIVFDGHLVRSHNKTEPRLPGEEWIDYGLTVMTAAPVRAWPEPDPFELSAVTAALARKGEVGGYAVHKRFYEIGKPEGLHELEAYLASEAS